MKNKWSLFGFIADICGVLGVNLGTGDIVSSIFNKYLFSLVLLLLLLVVTLIRYYKPISEFVDKEKETGFIVLYVYNIIVIGFSSAILMDILIKENCLNFASSYVPQFFTAIFFFLIGTVICIRSLYLKFVNRVNECNNCRMKGVVVKLVDNYERVEKD